MSAVGSVAEVHPACYSAGTGDYFPEAKVARLETNHSPLSKAEVKNKWKSSPLPGVPSCTHKGTAKTVPKNSKQEKNKAGCATLYRKQHTGVRARARTHIQTHARNEERIDLNFFCILVNSLMKLTNEN